MATYQFVQPIRETSQQVNEHRRNHLPRHHSPTAQFPLRWWRTRAPEGFNARDLTVLRKALIIRPFVTEHDWYRAITGDAAAAIGIAARQMLDRSITAPEIDLSVTAVLACALEGDAASRVLISSALRRRAKIDPTCKCLSEKWLGRRL